jgi:hypothetical protein
MWLLDPAEERDDAELRERVAVDAVRSEVKDAMVMTWERGVGGDAREGKVSPRGAADEGNCVQIAQGSSRASSRTPTWVADSKVIF